MRTPLIRLRVSADWLAETGSEATNDDGERRTVGKEEGRRERAVSRGEIRLATPSGDEGDGKRIGKAVLGGEEEAASGWVVVE
jgi:hypothetical protein